MIASKQRMWDERWMSLALHYAEWSKDRGRQVGAVIVGPDQEQVSSGWNGFPRGVDDTIESRHARPTKYAFTKHAEENAILNAARMGASTRGCTMYIPWFPCANCAGDIVQAGISCVVVYPFDHDDPRWGESMRQAAEILFEGGVTVRVLPGSPPPNQEKLKDRIQFLEWRVRGLLEANNANVERRREATRQLRNQA
jgi:dCMP deaminase